jgi:Ca2+-transporting ATPase
MIVGFTIVIQWVMVEFLKQFASTERLDWGQWCAYIRIAALSWPIGWLFKFIPFSGKQLVKLRSKKLYFLND